MESNILPYKDLFNLSQDLIAIANSDGFFKKVNPQWTKKLGFTEEELLSTPIMDFIHPEDKAKTKDMVQQQIDGMKISQFHNRYIGKRGQVLHLEWNTTAVDLTGDIFAIARDVTKTVKNEQKQELMLRELKAKNKQLEDYAFIASHNLRSPVANIFTLANFLKETELETQQQEYADLIQNCANTLNKTMEDLINAVKVNQSTDLNIKHVSLDKICNEVLVQLSSEIITQNAQINTDFSEICTIQYSETYMRSIFLNLISNSLKYRSTSRPPLITIKSKKKSGSIHLIFRDNGSGIDLEKHRNKVFGFRKTFHNHPNSRGFGLFMTKSQVEALNGTISIDSKPEKGTIFTIDIAT